MRRTTVRGWGMLAVPVMVAVGLLVAPAPAQAYGPGTAIATGELSQQVVFSHDGTTAWVSNRLSGTVSVIDVASGTETHEIVVGDEPHGIAISPDDSEVWVALLASPTATDLVVIDTADLSTTPISSGGNGAWIVIFDAAGDFAYVSNYHTNNVAKISTSTRAVVDSVTMGFAFPIGLELSANGQTLYVAQSAMNRIARLSTSSLDPVGAPIALPARPGLLKLTPDGSQLWATTNAGQISVVSTSTHSIVRYIDSGWDSVGLAFDSEGFAWVTADGTKWVRRVNPATGDYQTITYLDDAPMGVAAHPTKRLVYVTAGNSVLPFDLGVSRLAGPDRYATAVEISQSAFPSGASTVYIATGANYPDALAAGPVAARVDAPILLTRGEELPAVVAEELVRLDPDNIVVIGGPTTVSPDVESALAAFGSVTRIAGANRFETARMLVASVDFTYTWEAYIATGQNFPDALSGGAAAGVQRLPLLLVNGSAGSVDAATLDLLKWMGAQKVTILGSTSSVSAGIATSLSQAGLEVAREGGADRYETSLLINQNSQSTGETVVLATGTNFPDALAGTPLASALSAPLFVVRSDCLPRAVLDQFDRGGTRRVILLGGEPTLSVAVEDLTPCP
ncbi:YVTN family beta-propeller protein [Leifsonia sp. AK011]|uniref:cell wall-binding repeat-containing protein n=1 Tax=Leifsonia sp. AK011 TaxID=2723075 RepID=UPI0015CE47A6|nr:cell wall-binding repeat-containing protein [Leifsonia sp. AK011]NYF09840.1 YVTN family beta-propeller protein [Leifsonia sp. AK011]